MLKRKTYKKSDRVQTVINLPRIIWTPFSMHNEELISKSLLNYWRT